MSHWDSTTQRIVRIPSRPWPGYPGWTEVDCGCCGGLQWGGESPMECSTCLGTGTTAVHKSGAISLYPGGPFCGHKLGEGSSAR